MDRIGEDLYISNMATQSSDRTAVDTISARTAERAIASYNLFGESADLPDVVHCETIAARSVLHDWEFRPHRHARLHQLLLVTHGGGAAHLEGSSASLGPKALVNVPMGSVHAFSFRPGTHGWVVTLAGEMLDEVLARASDVRRALARAAVVRAKGRIATQMEMIAAEFDGRSYARAQVLRGLTSALLGLVARHLVDEAPAVDWAVDAASNPASDPACDRAGHPAGKPAARKVPAEAPLLARFEALIEAHFIERWGVADYARALAVTPTHLSRVARQATGQPASRLVDDRLIREARRQLVYTNLQVATIAYALGYADPAHFSRVFSRATGLSPRAFRDRR